MAVDKSFVVKNGLEVNSDLIVADANSKKVGIASTSPRSTLDVRGGIAATDGNFTGILTAASVDISDFGVVNGSGANITGFSTLGGLSVDQLTVTGVATFADLTYDEITGRNLNLSGIATVPVFEGLTSFNDGVTVSGVSTISTLNVSGVATIATVDINAGDIEVTNVDTTDLNVTDVGTIANARVTNLDVTGIGTVATANITTLSNYPNFTGGATVVGTVTAAHFSGGGLGVGIKTSGSVIGYGFTMLNFVGSGNTFAVNGTTVDISIAGGGGGGGSGSASIGVGSTPGDAFSGIITAGNLWYNTGLGRLFIYYQDDNSAQWVDAAPFNVGIITTLTNVSFDAGSVSAPSVHFGSDSNSGFFSPSDGSVTVSSNGVGVVTFNGSGVTVNGVVNATTFSGDGSGLTGVASTDNIQTATEAEFLGGVKIAGVATVGVVTGGTSVSATHFYGDGSALTGIDATAIKDSGGNVKAQANPNGIVITGVATATSFVGDLTGSVTGAATQVTVADESSDTSCNVLFTTAATGDQAPKTGTNLTFNSNSGQLTATSFSGDGSALTGVGVGTQDNINTSGIITATSFSGDGSNLTFAPKIIAFDPAALAVDVAIDKTITITFDQNIVFDGNGTVSLRDGSASGSVIQDFAISSGTPATGLSISGTQLIINPTSNFDDNTVVYVVLPSSGIENAAGTVYGGSNNYNFRTVTSSFSASGGDYEFTSPAPTSPTGYYRYHVFASSGILTTTSATPTATDFQMLMMAGGGGGGNGGYPPPGGYKHGGGGGAGGRISKTGPQINLPAGTYTLTVGAAGYGGGNVSGIGTQNPNYGPGNVPVPSSYYYSFYATNGGDSSIAGPTISTLTAIGGGHGAHTPLPNDIGPTDHRYYGAPGGSGGGSGNLGHNPGGGTGYSQTQPYPQASPTFSYGNSGAGTPTQGYAGGGYINSPTFSSFDPPYQNNANPTSRGTSRSGGGGGAGGAGGNAEIHESFFAPNPTPMNNNQTRAGYLRAGGGGNGATNPAFPDTALSGNLPGDFTSFLNSIGPTGLMGGGGGGASNPSFPGGSNPSYGSVPDQYRGLGGPGGGGDGAGEGPSPQSLPQYRGGDGLQYTGSGGGGGLGVDNESGGHGGSGIIMVRYASPS